MKIDLTLLPTLWYEDGEGRRHVPSLEESEDLADPPPGFVYQLSRFPMTLHETMLRTVQANEVAACNHPAEDVRKTYGWIEGTHGRECMRCRGTQLRQEGEEWPDAWDAYGSREVMRGSSSWSEDLVLEMSRPRWRFLGWLLGRERYSLSDAILIAANACERCLNALGYRYGLAWGYAEGSEEWERDAVSVLRRGDAGEDGRREVIDKTTTRGAGEARVRAMSTEDLEGNLGPLARVVLNWTRMSRGELDRKPECALCGYALADERDGGGGCHHCALHVIEGRGDEEEMHFPYGATFDEWYVTYVDALDHPWCCDSMRAPTVLAAAARMRDLLARLLGVVEDELARRRGGSPTVTATISPDVEAVQTWGGFEENTPVYHRPYGKIGVVTRPESSVIAAGYVPVLFEDEEWYRGLDSDDLDRVDCHTCADTSCERNGPMGLPRTTAMPNYEECWKAPPVRDALVAEIDDVLPRDRVVAEVARALGHLDAANATLIDSLARCRGVERHRDAEGEAERCSGFVLSATFALRRLVEYLTDEDADVAVKRIGACQ
jgi:hypothetical protein